MSKILERNLKILFKNIFLRAACWVLVFILVDCFLSDIGRYNVSPLLLSQPILHKYFNSGINKLKRTQYEGVRMMGVADTLETGMLIAYERKGHRNFGFGVINKRDDKKNWQVYNEDGKICSINSKQILHILQTSKAVVPSELQSVVGIAEERQDASLLELVWETLRPEDVSVEDQNASISPEEVCELAFGNRSPEACVSMCLMLLGSWGRIYFHQFKTPKSGLSYTPKVPGVVESLKKVAVAEQQRNEAEYVKQQSEKERQKRLIDLIQEGLKPNRVFDREAVDEKSWKELDDLMLMAAKSAGTDAPGPEEVAGKRILASLGRVDSRTNAWKLCVQLGLLEKHQNLWLQTSCFKEDYSAEVKLAVEEFFANPPKDPDAAIRKDLTHLKVFTIDSWDTFEVDDGLSMEILEDGTEKIWIHIADASRWVQKGTILEECASQRTTTVYLPDEVLPMFPERVASQMSLLPGRESYAMSCCVVLNNDGSIASVEEVVPSKLEVTYKITYEDVQDMIYTGLVDSEEKELGRLLHWASVRRKYRASKGSLDANNPKPPESKVKARRKQDAEDGWEVTIEAEDINTESYLMVTEMMILAGEAVARYSANRKITVPFRSQRQPEDLPNADYFENLPEKYCRAMAFFKFMKPAEVTLRPEPHAGLALDCYIQWSSPIRRYSDLLVHYQLKADLHGEAGLNELEMTGALYSLDGTVKHAGNIMSKSKRYWTFEYFRRQINHIYECHVIAVWDSRDYGGKVAYTLLLPEIGARVPYNTKEQALELGSHGKVQILDANPKANILTVKLLK